MEGGSAVESQYPHNRGGLARGSLRDSFPSLRGSLRASFPSSDASFVSKLAWDFIGYPLYIFFYVGLLLRVFAR